MKIKKATKMNYCEFLFASAPLMRHISIDIQVEALYTVYIDCIKTLS